MCMNQINNNMIIILIVLYICIHGETLIKFYHSIYLHNSVGRSRTGGVISPVLFSLYLESRYILCTI